MSLRYSLTVVSRVCQQLAQTLHWSQIVVCSAVSGNSYDAQQTGGHGGPAAIKGRQHGPFPTVEVAGYPKQSLPPLLGGERR